MYLVNAPMDATFDITYETGTDEPLHPDFMVSSRFIEIGISDCSYGCKIYADPRSNVKVLGHAKVYGCDVTKETMEYYARVSEEIMASAGVTNAMVENAMLDLANMLGMRECH